MSYDADDPKNLLGGRQARSGTGPSAPLRTSGLLRGLTGDVKTINADQPVQLIDVEYDTPRPILVTGRAQAPAINAPNEINATWTLSTGLDRSKLNDQTFVAGKFSLVVLVRSLQLVVNPGNQAAAGMPAPYLVQAVAMPMDVSADIGNLSVMGGSSASDAPNSSVIVAGTQSVFPATKLDDTLSLAGKSLDVYGARNRRGATFYNGSAGGADLFIALSSTVPGAATEYTVKVVNGAYYEVPYDYSGPIWYWHSAAGAGGTVITALGATIGV